MMPFDKCQKDFYLTVCNDPTKAIICPKCGASTVSNDNNELSKWLDNAPDRKSMPSGEPVLRIYWRCRTCRCGWGEDFYTPHGKHLPIVLTIVDPEEEDGTQTQDAERGEGQ